ncbi:MAG: helix-turn-helix transcriptional regulator [Candidatus Woesearchaeota archaeon]
MSKFFKELKEIFFLTGMFAVFIGILIYLFYYIQQNYTISSCSCKTPVQLVLIGLVVLGIFLGASVVLFTSLYKNKNINQEEKEIKNGKTNKNEIAAFLKLAEHDERIVLNELIKNSGILKQSELNKNTDLSRVKITRTIKKLVQKNVLRVERKNGKNILYLSDEFLDFVK